MWSITDVNEYRLGWRVNGRHPRGQRREEPERRHGGLPQGRPKVRVGLEMSGAPPFRVPCWTHHESRRSCVWGFHASDMSIDWTKLSLGLFIKGIYGRECSSDGTKMAARSITVWICHRLSPIVSLLMISERFDAMRSGRSGKVILSWD